MRTDGVPERLNQGRVRKGEYGTRNRDGLRGAFHVVGPLSRLLRVISSGVDREYGWEHVSVSMEHRVPTWIEMCWVKNLFWSEDEVVMQLHPAKDQYVNHHPHCLHLWKPVDGVIPTPPALLVGPLASPAPTGARSGSAAEPAPPSASDDAEDYRSSQQGRD